MEMNDIQAELREVTALGNHMRANVDKITGKYVNIINSIIPKEDLTNYSDEELCSLLGEFNNANFYINTGLEKVKAIKCIADESYKEKYSLAFNVAEGTNLARQKEAESKTIKERIAVETYTTAIESLESHSKAVYEYINALKTIIRVRLANLELSRGKQ